MYNHKNQLNSIHACHTTYYMFWGIGGGKTIGIVWHAQWPIVNLDIICRELRERNKLYSYNKIIKSENIIISHTLHIDRVKLKLNCYANKWLYTWHILGLLDTIYILVKTRIVLFIIFFMLNCKIFKNKIILVLFEIIFLLRYIVSVWRYLHVDKTQIL